MIFRTLLFTTILFSQQEFDFDGPYGINYFDTADQFTVQDLNSPVIGDVNADDILNIQDIIMVIGNILGTITLNESETSAGDVNNDNIIDILDIVQIVDRILTGSSSGWDFAENWTGNDSYIFIHLQPSASLSTALWGSTTKSQLLANSPTNVHYFFLSSRTTSASDIDNIKLEFDEIINGLPPIEQAHWKSHLHFVPERSLDMNNWLADALDGKKALAIDSFQKIREIGYLGNPATFNGTYIHYLAHEAEYFKYELGVFSDTGEPYDEITVFDRTHYTGGWAASISETITLPSDSQLSEYDKIEVELLRGCPDANMNYSDAGCDDYDRIARMFICDEDGSNCLEITKWITPFDRQPHSLTDITPMLAAFRPGGTKTIKFQESGWPNSLLTLKIRMYDLENNSSSSQQIIPIWNGTVLFNPDYNDNRPPTPFVVPSNTTKVEFVTSITGHGWGSAGCFNCAEFCNSKHIFEVNGGVFEFEKAHPNASDNDYCMELSTIAQGVIPNQYGTWGYGRAGWCPGQDVKLDITDITDFMSLGDENIIDYSACRVSGSSCVAPPTCGGDGYCPEIAMFSYIIIYY
jgi:hypothetical protein